MFQSHLTVSTGEAWRGLRPFQASPARSVGADHMRIAIIADIHANHIALDAVLADIEALQPDQIVCPGDVAATGPQPRQVVQRLRSLGCPVVMGNADAWLLDPQPAEASDEDTRRVEAIDSWCAAQLAPAGLAYLRTFQPTIELRLGGDAVLLCY